MAEYTLSVAGVTRDVQLHSLSVRRPASGIHTLVCEIESADGSYRPSLDDDVILYEDDGTSPTPQMFGGIIMRVRERAQTGTGAPILSEIQCSDYSVLAYRTVVSATFAAGTMKSQLQTLVTDHLSTQGITLHASQIDGPDMEAVTHDTATGTAVLNAICLAAEAAGNPMVWRIDYDKVLRVFVPGTESAPNNITELNRAALGIVGDITVERSHAEGYATRIIVKFGSGTALQTETFTGDGTTTEFETDLPAELGFEIGRITRVIDIVSSSVASDTLITTTQNHGLRPGDRIRISGHSGSTPDLNNPTGSEYEVKTTPSVKTFTIGPNVSVGGTGGTVRDSIPFGVHGSGSAQLFRFTWDAVTHTIHTRDSDDPIPSGSRLELTYSAQYPATEIVTGSPPGTIDKVIEAPEAFTRAAARAIGEAELARSSSDLIRVDYRTQDGVGLAPGQVQSIVESYRNLNHSCLITEIATRDISADLVEHTVSLIANDQYLPGWRKVYADWLGGGSGASAGVATGTITLPTETRETGEVLVEMREITHDEILAGSPVTLVPSPGPGFALVPVHFQTSRDFFTAYTTGSPATDTDLSPVLRYDDENEPALSHSDTSPGPSELNGFSLREIPDSDHLVADVEDQPLVVTWDAVDGGGHSSNILRVSVAYYIVPVADSSLSMVQVMPFQGSVSYSTTVSTYLQPFIGCPNSDSAVSETAPWPVSGVLSFLRLEIAAAPGSGASWTFTLMVNGVDTSVVVTISDSATVGTWSGSLAITAGDLIIMRVDPANGPATGAVNHTTLEFEPTSPVSSGYVQKATVTSVTQYVGAFGAGASNVSGDAVANLSPLSGDIVAIHGYIAAAASASTITCTLYKNGVAQDGSGGTPDTRLVIASGSGAAATASLSVTVPMSPGDTFYVEMVRTSGATRSTSWSCRVDADEPSQSIMAAILGAPSAAANRWAPIRCGEAATGWATATSDAAHRTTIGPTAITLSDLYVTVASAPTAGKSRTFTVRAADVDSSLSATIADANVEGSDLSDEASVPANAILTIAHVPSGTPTVDIGALSLVQTAE